MAIAPIATLGDVPLDVVESDKPTHESEITDKPVEKNADVSDHMKLKSPMLSISGVCVGDDAWTRLRKIRQYQLDGELVTYTNRVIYTDMAIESISTDHGRQVANGFWFDITLKRVRISAPKEIQIVNVPPAVQTKAKETKNAGVKQTVKTGKQSVKPGAAKSSGDTEVKLADKIRDFKSE